MGRHSMIDYDVCYYQNEKGYDKLNHILFIDALEFK